jgi:hypothetical protein
MEGTVLQAVFDELQERGIDVDWYDECCDAFVICSNKDIDEPQEFHFWIKDYWLYYWYQDIEIHEAVTRRIDLNDPAFFDKLWHFVTELVNQYPGICHKKT